MNGVKNDYIDFFMLQQNARRCHNLPENKIKQKKR